VNQGVIEVEKDGGNVTGYFSIKELAGIYEVDESNFGNFKKRLERWRKNHLGSENWVEDSNPKHKRAKYLFRASVVSDIFKTTSSA
jgi:hypothetical protein